jgi:hypothetical protein
MEITSKFLQGVESISKTISSMPQKIADFFKTMMGQSPNSNDTANSQLKNRESQNQSKIAENADPRIATKNDAMRSVDEDSHAEVIKDFIIQKTDCTPQIKENSNKEVYIILTNSNGDERELTPKESGNILGYFTEGPRDLFNSQVQLRKLLPKSPPTQLTPNQKALADLTNGMQSDDLKDKVEDLFKQIEKAPEPEQQKMYNKLQAAVPEWNHTTMPIKYGTQAKLEEAILKELDNFKW